MKMNFLFDDIKVLFEVAPCLMVDDGICLQGRACALTVCWC